MSSEIQGAKVVTLAQILSILSVTKCVYLWNSLLLSQYKYTTLEHFNMIDNYVKIWYLINLGFIPYIVIDFSINGDPPILQFYFTLDQMLTRYSSLKCKNLVLGLP